MKLVFIAASLLLGLIATAVVAQTYVDTPGGKMAACANFYWNGTAWVASTR